MGQWGLVTILSIDPSSFSRHLCSCSSPTPRAPRVHHRLLTRLLGQALPVSSAPAARRHVLPPSTPAAGQLGANCTVIGPGSPASGRPASIADAFFPTPRATTTPGKQSAHLFTLTPEKLPRSLSWGLHVAQR